MSPRTRWIVVTLVVSLHLAGDMAAVPITYRLKLGDGTGFGLFVILGAFLGQISLLAGYLAWGLDLWVARWSKSGFLAVLAWYAITVGAVSTGDSFEVSSIEQLLAMVIGMSFLIAPIPYWAMRPFCRSRFEDIQDERISADLARRQFRIQDILIWTAAAAVLLAMLRSPIGRETRAQDWSISPGDWATLALWMSVWTSLCGLMAIPAAWACLGKHKPAPRLLGVGAYAAIVVATQCAVLAAVVGDDRQPLWVVGLNLGVLCEVVACSFILRACGYRLRLYAPRGRQSESLA